MQCCADVRWDFPNIVPVAAFRENEAAANARYLGKVIEVSGKVREVQRANRAITIQLDGVSCSFLPAAKPKLPSTGEMIHIKGKCAGSLMDVSLVDCVTE